VDAVAGHDLVDDVPIPANNGRASHLHWRMEFPPIDQRQHRKFLGDLTGKSMAFGTLILHIDLKLVTGLGCKGGNQ
jgi:hypothetical protein